MASQKQDRSELDAKAKQGETVVPGGTGGKSLEAQERLAEGAESRRADEEGAIRARRISGAGAQGRRDKKGANGAGRVPRDGQERRAEHNGEVGRRASGRRRNRD